MYPGGEPQRAAEGMSGGLVFICGSIMSQTVINRTNFVYKGKAAASGERARKGHEGDGAGDAAEGEGGRAFQDLGRTGRQLPSASGQTKAS